MRSAIALANVVGETQDVFVVTIVPLEGDFNADIVFFAKNDDGLMD